MFVTAAVASFMAHFEEISKGVFTSEIFF